MDDARSVDPVTTPAPGQLGLLQSRRFLPLFMTQFLGALNDNVFKNALVILITFVTGAQSGMSAETMVPAVAGLFVAPFFLFSATAGQLADKVDKATLIRRLKLVEVVLMVLAGVGFVIGNASFLMLVLFLMGTQSTFFGPVKYSILPEQLEEKELIGGNALIAGATFVAIICGTMIGGLLIVADGGAWLIGALIVVVAACGWFASRFIPPTEAANPGLVFDHNFVRQSWRIVAHAARTREVFLPILGLSWFWFLGSMYMTQAPSFTKDYMGGNQELVTVLLIVFAVGIAAGSLLCNRLLNGQVHATYVPLGALGLALFSLDLYFVVGGAHAGSGDGPLIGAAEFLSVPANWHGLADLFAIGVSGGLYMVPLTAMLQQRSEAEHRARNIAASNIMNSLFMVLASVAAIGMLALGLNIPQMLLVLCVASIAVAVYISRLLPGALAKGFLAWVLHLLYRVEVRGLEHYHAAGDKVLIVANHTSFLDAALLAAFLPDRLTFAIGTQISKSRLVQFFTQLAKTYPVDPGNPYATRSLIECVNALEKTVIFPEGRITVTGALMKVFEGPGMIADRSGAMVLPVRLDGAQYTPFSHLKGRVRLRWFPKIRVQVMPPRRLQIPAEIKGRRRRRVAGQMLYDLMTDMMFESSNYRRTIFQSLLDARATHGANHPVFEDLERKPLTYRKLTLASFALGRALARTTKPGERVGVLLPNVIGNIVTFLGLHAYGRVPAMLNFSTGSRNVALACETAKLATVLSSREFVRVAKLQDMVDAITRSGVKVSYLEDLGASLARSDKLAGVVGALVPGLFYRLNTPAEARDPDGDAVVLFTSGTEGAPKGVVLSHANLQANRYQAASYIDFGPTDIVLNAMPLFHSFGLTCGTILPMLAGLKVFLYPSPLHYRVVPAIAYDTNATIMFGTDTFLSGYARFADPYDFYSMRYVFAGAEKLKDETRRVYSERYGCRIFEGYGATETAPMLAMNSPMHNRAGTVGRLLPGVEHRLDAVPGVDAGGRLVVRGPNIMKGYLRVENPGVLEPPADGWYDTGDIVEIDDEGFVHIKGRAKRFAKIAGEMVSLPAVEEMAEAIWPGRGHAAVTLPDPRKGEQLVLVTDCEEATRDALLLYGREHGVSEVAIPRRVVIVNAIPVLGTGKTDFRGALAMVEAQAETG